MFEGNIVKQAGYRNIWRRVQGVREEPDWTMRHRVNPGHLVLVSSFDNGDFERNVSPNLVPALEYAQLVGPSICGVVGWDGGHTPRIADACVILSRTNPGMVTPHTEAFQAVIWHLLVSHPALQIAPTKWEWVR